MNKIVEASVSSIIASNQLLTFQATVANESLLSRASVPAGRAKLGIEPVANFMEVYRQIAFLGANLIPGLIGLGSNGQKEVDGYLKEIQDKYGNVDVPNNATLSFSIAFARQEAASREESLDKYIARLADTANKVLPFPMATILDTSPDSAIGDKLLVDNFLFCPVRAKSFAEAQEMLSTMFNKLKIMLKEQKKGHMGGAGFILNNLAGSTKREKTEEVMQLLSQAITNAGYTPGKDMSLGIVGRGNELWKGKDYSLGDRVSMNGEQMADLFQQWVNQYHIVSLLNCMATQDSEGHRILNRGVDGKAQLLTQPTSIGEVNGADTYLADAIVVEPSQLKTLSEVIDFAAKVSRMGCKLVIKREEGATEDPATADIAVGIGAPQIITSAPFGADTTTAYNQLMRIAETRSNASFAGRPL